ncbi:MAG: hypothetical protein HGN29_08210 [Asgard group archaeon]|nr:hypothetical protein [Asgard group archaeon]
MSKIGKLISRLFTLAVFGAWFTFVIWGLKTWGTPDPFVSEKTTIILLSLLTFIGMFILFIIASALGAIGKKRKKEEKEEEKKFSFTTKDGDKMEFKGGEDFDIEKIPAPFREIGKKFMEMAKKEMDKEK